MYLSRNIQVGECGRRAGFTLIEVLLAVIILGMGITASIHTIMSGTTMSMDSDKMTTANFLASEVGEWTRTLPFSDQDPSDWLNPPGPDSEGPYGPYVDDVDDLLGATFSPPLNAAGVPIKGMDGWSQKILMTWRDRSNPSIEVDPGTSDLIYIQAVIAFRGEVILSTGWLLARSY